MSEPTDGSIFLVGKSHTRAPIPEATSENWDEHSGGEEIFHGKATDSLMHRIKLEEDSILGKHSQKKDLSHQHPVNLLAPEIMGALAEKNREQISNKIVK